MRIGLVAYDYPPNLGGMGEHAYQMALTLSRSHEVNVYVRPQFGSSDSRLKETPILTGDRREDGWILARESQDAWIILEASGALLSQHLKVPVVIYMHGNDLLDPPVRRRGDALDLNWLPNVKGVRRLRGMWHRTRTKREIRNNLPYAAAVWTNSKNTAGLINKNYGREAVVVHPGVRNCFFETPLAGSFQSPLRLVSASRLHHPHRKNIPALIHAVARLPREIVESLTIIGDGPAREQFESLARESDPHRRIRFTGRIDYPQMAKMFAEADLFVLAPLATKLDVEGFGMVYAEASAAGTPALASEQAGATDAVSDGINGIFIANSDAQSVANGIRAYSNRISEFSRESCRNFAMRFSWQDLGMQIERELALLSLTSPEAHAQSTSSGRRSG